MKQQKRWSTLGLIGVFLLLLSLVVALPVGAAPSGAVAGTVTMDKTFITTPDGVVKVTVEDADLDVAVQQTNEDEDYSGDAYSVPDGTQSGAFLQVRVQKFPILDSTLDGFVNFADAAVSIAGLQVWQVSAVDGLVTLKATQTFTADTAYTLTYKAADIQTTPSAAGNGAVKVTSTQDTTGFILVLKETTASSGKFEATFKTGTATVTANANDPNNATRPVIAVVSGAIITVSYTDASPAATRAATTTVETTKPVVSVVSPETGAATQNVNPKLIANFTDSDSTVDKTTIDFVITGGGATVGTITTNAIAGGFQAETTLTGLGAGETTVTWYATANDKAGNVGRSDSSATTAEDQDHTLYVDTVAPDFATPTGAITGQWWDTTKTTTNKTETAATKAKTTSIRVIFGEALDGSSIQPSDFTVDGVAPAAAEWFSGAASSVFLTVPAMASDKRPTIALTGAVSDKAGNSRTSSALAPIAADGIAPTITVAVNPKLDKKTVTIEVGSNEALLTAPTIDLNNTTQSAPSLVATNLFRLTREITTAARYNVEVSAQDTSGNAKTAGTDDPTATGAILFEIDNALPAVTGTSPANNASVYTASPFITIDWSSEGIEYTGDTHKKVTLTKLTLDGVNVLASAATADNITHILATSGLALGEHTVVFNGADEAGNVLATDVTVKFTVKERPPFDVTLSPGWNLVSIPSDPADPAINSVIGAAHPIDAVLSYDAVTGAWKTATRDSGTGLLVGDLTSLASSRAYWVHTTSFEKLPVTLAEPSSSGAVLPTIQLQAGWNLVPVLKVDVGAADVSADVYLRGTNWVRAYYFNTVQDKFIAISPGTTTTPAPDVVAGRGYWVYVPAAIRLVP